MGKIVRIATRADSGIGGGPRCNHWIDDKKRRCLLSAGHSGDHK